MLDSRLRSPVTPSDPTSRALRDAIASIARRKSPSESPARSGSALASDSACYWSHLACPIAVPLGSSAFATTPRCTGDPLSSELRSSIGGGRSARKARAAPAMRRPVEPRYFLAMRAFGVFLR